jgi:hypothetical protein
MGEQTEGGMMLVDILSQQQAKESSTPPTVVLAQAQPSFKDTFFGQVLLSVTVAVVTAYLTAALIKRRGGG